MTIEIPKGYETLGEALAAAVDQAAAGKGAGRHSYGGELFSEQLIFEIPRRLGACGSGFLLGQAVKKIYESVRLEPERARAELLGAINYLAAAWSRLDCGGSDAPAERLFRPGEDVEILDGGGWRPASYVRPEDGGLHTVLLGSSRLSLPASGIRKASPGAEDADAPRSKDELVRRIREANPAVYPQEDADMPRFQKGELVEYRSDGTWKPAAFMYMDGGYAVLVSGGEKVEVLAFNVRPAEKS